MEHCSEGLDKLEMQIMQAPKKALLDELSLLRQQLLAVHRVMVPHRDEVRDFIGAALGVMTDRLAQDLREYGDRVVGLVTRSAPKRQRYAMPWSYSVCSQRSRPSDQSADHYLRRVSAAEVFNGFFGMNFQWMIGRIGSVEAFLLLGIGLFAAILAFMLGLFWWRGWLRE